MKRFLISVLVAVLACTSALAGDVTPQRAKKIADRFMEATLVSSDDYTYVFNRPSGGFIIVAADDIAAPVLGYSYTGHADKNNMPPALKAMLDEFKARIDSGRKNGTPQSAKIKRLWNELEMVTKSDDLPDYDESILYTTASWNQNAPYNLHCPELDSGVIAVTGCIATAAAILAKFFRYPEHGAGIVPGYNFIYNSKLYKIPDHELGHDYDWDNMPLSYGRTWTEEQGDAVATLMYDFGTAAQLEYGDMYTGTYGYDSKIAAALAQYFGYTYDSIEERNNYPDSLWMLTLKENLSKIGPIYYTATTESSGHAFLLTGYDTKDNIYINWGWGGQYNGYFALNEFQPDPRDPSSAYLYYHRATLGLKPSGTEPQADPLDKVTKVDFNKADNQIVITTYRDVKYTFLDPDGKESTRGIIKEGKRIVLNKTVIKPGTYTLILSKGDETKSLELVFN